jgi:hypothetical protein
VVRAYQDVAAGAIRGFDGSIAQYLGDGILAYFGYPHAHEDDARRAVAAGLALVDDLGTLNQRLEVDRGIRLAVRIGIHTGTVVVGAVGGRDRQEQLALGEVPNVAARIQGLADPNAILVSGATARLLGGAFRLEERGDHALKGVANAVSIVRVMGPVEPEDPDEEIRPAGTRLVGRDEEVGLLARRWEQTKEGLGQVVLVSGEAGIGKSRLVETARAQAARDGAIRVTYQCSPYHTGSSFYPVIKHLHRVLALQRDEASEARLTKLERQLQADGLTPDEHVPLLAALLSIPLRPPYRPPGLTPQQQKQQTMDALVAWLMATAERRPVLAVWKDLHWADPSTLELLGLLVDQSPTVPMLSVLTYRPDFQPPWPMRSHMTPLTLNRLERPQVEVMVAELAGGRALPAEVVRHIVAKTDGVPLFVEELTKAILESGLLREDGGPLHAHGAPHGGRDPGDPPGLAHGAPGPPPDPAGGGPVRSRAGAGVCLRDGAGAGGNGEGGAPAWPRPAGGGRTALPARPAASGALRVQARPHPGCGVRLAAAQHPAAGPPAGRGAARGALSRDRRHRARAGRASLHRGGQPRAGGGLLARGWSARGRAVGEPRGRESSPAWARGALEPAGHPGARAPGALAALGAWAVP